MKEEGEPKRDWARHAYRVMGVVDNQMCSLQKRQLIDSYKATEGLTRRKGSFWGLRSQIHNYHLSDAQDCPFEPTIQLDEIATRLKRMTNPFVQHI